MKIVLFIHGRFLPSKSMPRFAGMIETAFRARGHDVEIWEPKPLFYKLSGSESIRKYLGYIDQFLLFPIQVRLRLPKTANDTLFVFSDNALGPWVPLVKNRKHVIHCHDFLAQRASLNQIAEHTISTSGKWYQAFIRWGYRQGKNFISVSNKTRSDLHTLLGRVPSTSEVVFNGLNNDFATPVTVDKNNLPQLFSREAASGFILHVGGNQWYKNRLGVIQVYNAWRSRSSLYLPLVLIGPKASQTLQTEREKSPFKNDIFFLADATDEVVKYAYQHASVFLFPSLAEGFGWPIAEAMSAGCITITTGEDPMKEVGGNAAFYIPRKPFAEDGLAAWQKACAQKVEDVLKMPLEDKEQAIENGKANALRFNTSDAMDAFERIYQSILINEGGHSNN